MPALPREDGTSRTTVLAGAGREWGSSVRAGEGLFSGHSCSVQSGLCFTSLETSQLNAGRRIMAQQLCAATGTASSTAGIEEGSGRSHCCALHNLTPEVRHWEWELSKV